MDGSEYNFWAYFVRTNTVVVDGRVKQKCEIQVNLGDSQRDKENNSQNVIYYFIYIFNELTWGTLRLLRFS